MAPLLRFHVWNKFSDRIKKNKIKFSNFKTWFDGFSRDRNFQHKSIETSKNATSDPVVPAAMSLTFHCHLPPRRIFLIIRFPNLESSAWGIKFSSGPVEQTGTVGVCFHLLLEDNPIPLMGADCTHHIISTQLIWQCSAGTLHATGRRTDFLKFDLRQFHVSLNFKFKLNLTEYSIVSQKHNLFNTGMKVKFYACDTCLRNRRNRKE